MYAGTSTLDAQKLSNPVNRQSAETLTKNALPRFKCDYRHSGPYHGMQKDDSIPLALCQTRSDWEVLHSAY